MLQIRPPLLLDNALPMPLGITVWDNDTLLTRCFQCSGVTPSKRWIRQNTFTS